MNVIEWFIGGFLTEFSNEFMNVGCWCMCNVLVWMCGYICVFAWTMDVLKKGFDDGEE